MKSSVALTTYNGSKFIVELLDSLKEQTRKPDEVIIVDDVSTDDTIKIVREYIEEYHLSNWRIIRNESNLGWKKNFRKAVGLCTGEVIFFCDQDDIWHKDKINLMCEAFEQNSDIQVLISNYVLLSQGNKQTKGQKGSERDDGKLEKIQGWKKVGTIARPGCTQAFTKKLADIMGEFDDIDCSHDHIMYNLGLITDSLFILNRQLIDFRRHTNNASTYKISFGKKRKAIEALERVKVCDVLMNYSNSVKDKQKYKEARIRKDFYSRRNEIFDNGNIFNMIVFVFSNLNQYGTARDVAVDLAAMVK